ncbi:MAG: hypothetical protein LZF62_420013 [Nitrospira sp.]|nr:MAG: hypothetical protein LZF62_420013 [Nitrospira sp.]
MVSVPQKKVAVVVPMHNRSTLTVDEEISFRHLTHYLGSYDKYLVVPDSLQVSLPGCALKRFGMEYFGSAIANTRLLLSEHFYRSFSEYQYILIYHLDALVFSDQLTAWCDAGLDYIGPPWIPCADSPWVKESRVGNGGLSLRRIDSFLKVFQSNVYWMDPEGYWKEKYAGMPAYLRWLNTPKRLMKRLPRFNSVRLEMSQWHLRPDGTKNEDHFWSDRAKHYVPDFKVASVEDGLRFAFEVAPRLCYDMNHGQLPFGCHAWPRYDRGFWEPHLLASQAE